MSYRRYTTYSPSYLPSYTPYTYTVPGKTVREVTTTTTTEHSYNTPSKYSYETTTTTERPSIYPYSSYRLPLTTASYGYSPKWYDTSSRTTTTKLGPYGVSTRTYRY